MKKTLIKILCRTDLLPLFPSHHYFERGGGIAALNDEYILCGICLDSTSTAGAFHAEIYVMVLVPPQRFLHFSIGRRLMRPSQHWETTPDGCIVLADLFRSEIQKAYANLVTPISSISNFISNVFNLHPELRDHSPYTHESLALLHLIKGEESQFKSCLRTAHEYFKAWTIRPDIYAEFLGREAAVLSAHAAGREAVMRLMREWRRQSEVALKLPPELCAQKTDTVD